MTSEARTVSTWMMTTTSSATGLRKRDTVSVLQTMSVTHNIVVVVEVPKHLAL